MQRTTLDPTNSYFFSQQSRESQRRLRKSFDYQALYGKTEEVVLAYESRTATVAETLYRRKTSARPSSSRSIKRVSISKQHSVIFPPIDAEGPNLVSRDTAEPRTSHSDKRVDFLQVAEKPPASPKRSEYKFSEAKFNSTSILSRLARYLPEISEQPQLSLPVNIHDLLLQTYDQLITGVTFEKREWQTEGYLDLFRSHNRHPFLTGVPEDQPTRDGVEASIGRIAKRQEEERSQRLRAIAEERGKKKGKQRGREKAGRKRARMSKDASPQRKSNDRSPERPMTARSVMSSMSMRSDYSRHSSIDERETQYDFDILPAELRPSILHYRRESRTPKTKSPGPRTRLERFRTQREPTKKKSTCSGSWFPFPALVCSAWSHSHSQFCSAWSHSHSQCCSAWSHSHSRFCSV